jgi:pimeloyl-ACP methyl ester carboxylesterase
VPVSDLDITRAAHLLIQQHGDGATAEARKRVDDMRRKGDTDGADNWLGIIDAIEKLPPQMRATTSLCTDRRRLLISCAKLGVAFVTGSVELVLAEAGAAHLDFREGYAKGDGVRLYFVESGDGPLMLFLHGAPDSWALYEPQLREFAGDHLAVAPNLRGFPPSDAPGDVEAYAMRHLLNDVHGLIDHFGRESCVLVGNDWGGYIAWVFASAYPARVNQLIILNAPHPAIHLREVQTNAAQNHASQYEREFNEAAAPYPPWYNYYRADPIKVPISGQDRVAMDVPDLAAHFFVGVSRPPASASLRVRVPTLVFWGMRDPALLPDQLDGLEVYVPDLTVMRIDGAGHYPMRSHPTVVNQAIRGFLARSN